MASAAARMPSRRLLWGVLLAGFIVASAAGICVGWRALDLARSYKQDYVSDEIYYVDTARRYLINIFHININYYNFSSKTSKNYFNLEHPPLGKYVIALSMLACGDKPLCWRLPGIIEASLIPPIIYLGFASRRHPLLIAAGVVAALAVASDQILYRDASVAMLDIHLAFFTALSIALALAGRYRASLVAAALAFGVKMTGAATIMALMILHLIISIRNKSYKKLLLKYSEIILITFIIYIIIYIPLLLYFGVVTIYKETLAALAWHTTSRPPGPPTSTPIGWILNSNPFVFSYNLVDAAARTSTLVELAGLCSSIVMLLSCIALSLRGRECPTGQAPGAYVYLSVLALFAVIWVLGNHTFYSFYAVILAPAAGSAIGELLSLLLHSALRGAGVWEAESRVSSLTGEPGRELEGEPKAGSHSSQGL